MTPTPTNTPLKITAEGTIVPLPKTPALAQAPALSNAVVAEVKEVPAVVSTVAPVLTQEKVDKANAVLAKVEDEIKASQPPTNSAVMKLKRYEERIMSFAGATGMNPYMFLAQHPTWNQVKSATPPYSPEQLKIIGALNLSDTPSIDKLRFD